MWICEYSGFLPEKSQEMDMDVGCEWRSVFMELRSEVYFLIFEVVVFYAVIDEEAGSGIMALRLRLRK